MKWFRKSFLKKIYKNISTDKDRFCCKVNSWHTFFISFKDLKEVKENQKSDFIKSYFNGLDLPLKCYRVWFISKSDRIDFLQECINKLETKNFKKL